LFWFLNPNIILNYSTLAANATLLSNFNINKQIDTQIVDNDTMRFNLKNLNIDLTNSADLFDECETLSLRRK